LTLSQDSKVRDPPAPELDDPAMKEAAPPTPDKDEPAVNSIETPSAPDEADPVRVKLPPLMSPEPTVTEISPPVPEPEDPLDMTTAPLSPSVAIPFGM
jgi:hypothetical protein